MAQVNGDHFLQLGLKLLGFPDGMVQRSGINLNTERFRDGYHSAPNVVSVVFSDLSERYGRVDPSALLMAFFYLKKYPTKHSLAAFAKQTEKTALKKTQQYIEMIHSMVDEKVSFLFSFLFFF